MLVYVESNFVLEAALEQEENQAVQELINLAETKQIKLKFPVFALLEPYWTLKKRAKTHDNLLTSLSESFTDIKRSNLHNDLVNIFGDLIGKFPETSVKERLALDNFTKRLASVGQGIDINSSTFLDALSYRNLYQFEDFPDAVMYSSVVADLKQQEVTEPKCFVSRDTRAFGRKKSKQRGEEIQAELAKYGCEIMFEFKDALSFVKSSLNLS